MGTQINVTVDSGGLLERSKLQTAANRQAFAEGQQRTKAEQSGREQRSKRLAEEGLDEQGSPLPAQSASSRIERYRQEPAARRHGSSAKVLYVGASGDFTYVEACNDAGCTRHTYRTPITDIGPPGDPGVSAGSSSTTPDGYPFPSLPTNYREYGQITFLDVNGYPPTIPCLPTEQYLAYGGGYSWSETSWIQVLDKSSGGQAVQVTLPCSNEACIVAQVSFGAASFAYTYTSNSQTSTYSADPQGTTMEPCGEAQIFSYREAFQEATTFSSDSGRLAYPAAMACVLVGKKTQRQISAPSSLMNAIVEYYTSLNYTTVTETLSDPQRVGRNYTAVSYLSGVQYVSETSEALVYGQTPGFAYVTDEPQPVNLGLHSGYKGNGTVTPSIFAMLRAADTDEVRSIQTLEEYESWYARQLHRYTKINTVDPSIVKLDENKTGTAVWNWNATEYCISQLTALGFSRGELTL